MGALMTFYKVINVPPLNRGGFGIILLISIKRETEERRRGEGHA